MSALKIRHSDEPLTQGVRGITEIQNPMFKRSIKILVLVTLLCALVHPGWADNPPSEPEPVIVGASMESLYEANSVDVQIVFEFIYNEMLKDTGQTFDINLFDNNAILENEFREGNIQIIFIDSTKILELDSLIHPTARYVVQYGDSLKQRFLLLVKKDDPRRKLSEFRNGKLATCIGHLIGKRYLDVLLMQTGLPPTDRFFEEISVKQDVNATIVDLYFGRVDMALLPEYGMALARELNPQIDEELKIMSSSEPLIYQAVGFRYDLSEKVIDPIETRLLNKEPTKRLKKVFSIANISTFYRLTEDVLKETRALNEKYYQLLEQQQKP
ncbi:MAG: PhnD/SsuA/transferrin family substrate-binding protein [Candidatus Thiodiazotropha sp.]